MFVLRLTAFIVLLSGLILEIIINDRLLGQNENSYKDLRPEKINFGKGFKEDNSKEEDVSIRPFSIDFPEKELRDLNERLKADIQRIRVDLSHAAFWYGFNLEYLKTKILPYWLEKYDWKSRQTLLNSEFKHQYLTTIDGLDIHFARVTPSTTKDKKLIPVLCLHGWPGSYLEFSKLAEELKKSIPDNNFALELIIPSIPGFGFSSAAARQGMDAPNVARIFHELMTKRLGIETFYVQGGDWGSVVAKCFTALYPENVKGLHINFNPPGNGFRDILKTTLAYNFPRLFGIGDEEYEATLAKQKDFLKTFIRETGYLHVQATKPDSLGASMLTSPSGLAAWILEKFAAGTNMKMSLNRSDGALTASTLTLDELLDNVMIYWISRNGASAARFYYENFAQPDSTYRDVYTLPITVPSAIAVFPEEAAHAPKCVARMQFKNLVQFSYLAKGGHFAAFEQPSLFAEDLTKFIRTVENSIRV